MIRIGLLLLTVFMLPSCTIYQSIGHSFGSFVLAPNGQDFQPVGYRWDYEHTALLYVYRPASTWANDELESPSFYINDDNMFNVRGNGYTWYELEPGTHQVLVRRPLMGLEGIKVNGVFDFTLKMATELELNARAGQVIYLRYSEVDKDAEKFEDMTFHDNPLQAVTAEVALAEMQKTKMLNEGRGFITTKATREEKARKLEAEEQALEEEVEIESADDEGGWSPF
jgi:hypothetical protein